MSSSSVSSSRSSSSGSSSSDLSSSSGASDAATSDSDSGSSSAPATPLRRRGRGHRSPRHTRGSSSGSSRTSAGRGSSHTRIGSGGSSGAARSSALTGSGQLRARQHWAAGIAAASNAARQQRARQLAVRSSDTASPPRIPSLGTQPETTSALRALEGQIAALEDTLIAKEAQLREIDESILRDVATKREKTTQKLSVDLQAVEEEIRQLYLVIEALHDANKEMAIELTRVEAILSAVSDRLSARFPNFNRLTFANRGSTILSAFGTTVSGVLVETNTDGTNFDTRYEPAIVALVPIAFGLAGFFFGWLMDWRTALESSLADAIDDVKKSQSKIKALTKKVMPNEEAKPQEATQEEHLSTKDARGRLRSQESETGNARLSIAAASAATGSEQRIRVLLEAMSELQDRIAKTDRRIERRRTEKRSELKKVKRRVVDRFKQDIESKQGDKKALESRVRKLQKTENKLKEQFASIKTMLDIIVKINSSSCFTKNSLLYTSKFASRGFLFGSIFAGVFPVGSTNSDASTNTTSTNSTDSSSASTITYLWWLPYAFAVLGVIIGYIFDWYTAKNGSLTLLVKQLEETSATAEKIATKNPVNTQVSDIVANADWPEDPGYATDDDSSDDLDG